jgi:predicted DNA binding protein
MKDETTPPLTSRETEALYTALDRGYFDVPRHISLSALADELDTTDVELHERLRQGTAALLQSHSETLEDPSCDL